MALPSPPAMATERSLRRHHSGSTGGDAVEAILLLSDWDKYGVSERVCYHLDLIHNTTFPEEIGTQQTQEEVELVLSSSGSRKKPRSICGVVGLLECVPAIALTRLSKRQRRILRNRIHGFNVDAANIRRQSDIFCHEPKLPLRVSPMTCVSFAYETTRIAFCLDASPSLVSTYGTSSDDMECCPIDRLPEMVRNFFQALIKPIEAQSLEGGDSWQPRIFVTVLAVYPRGMETSINSVLVRNYQLHDEASADFLIQKVSEWALGEVEDEISCRLNSGGVGLGYETWVMPKFASSLTDIMDAGDLALSMLASSARPCIVMATDCRSLSSDGILDLFKAPERVDTPLVVLDLSSPDSHSSNAAGKVADAMKSEFNFLTSDPGGSSAFPHFMSDDSERIHAMANASGGCFFDRELLAEAAVSQVGQLKSESPLAADQFLRRRTLRANAVQWYVLFSLSRLTAAMNPLWGKLVPPAYLRQRLGIQLNKKNEPKLENSAVASGASRSTLMADVDPSPSPRRQSVPVTISTYSVPAIRVKSLILMRIKEGYRAKQYGQNMNDADKILIQFTFPIEFGTVLHYEVSFRSSPGQNPMIGVANVKIELSGDPIFIQNVKTEFKSHLTSISRGRRTTVIDLESARLCKFIQWIREQDKLLSSESRFMRDLASLSRIQRLRHFRLQTFDVVCTGQMPYAHNENILLDEFVDFDTGEKSLYSILSDWSSQVIQDKHLYIKQSRSFGSISEYCIIEVKQSLLASRLFSISLDMVGGSRVEDRLALMNSLQAALSKSRDIAVLSQHMNKHLVGIRHPRVSAPALTWRQQLLASHFDQESWDLVDDPELLHLLMRRRNEIAKFYLLHSTDKYALFAKFITMESRKSNNLGEPETFLVEYQIEFGEKGGEEVANVSVHMESETGFRMEGQNSATQRYFLKVKRRDRECSIALSSRTALLGLLGRNGEASTPRTLGQSSHVDRLLGYTSRQTRKLRFFQPTFATANKVLEDLNVDFLLSDRLEVEITKLDIKPSMDIGNNGPGMWFLVRFDHRTTSLVHLPLEEKAIGDGIGEVYREISFHTFSISDLYRVRQSIDDDESTDEHISEYLVLEDFAYAIESAHGENYARAAYVALRSQETGPEGYRFGPEDLDYGLDYCDFVKLTSVLVSREIRGAKDADKSKLVKTIRGLLNPVPGNKNLMYYHTIDEDLEGMLGPHDRSQSDDDTYATHDRQNSEDSGSDDEFSGDEFDSNVNSHQGEDEPSRLTEAQDANRHHSHAPPPLFVRFSLDGVEASIEDLSSISRSANLTAYVSIFKDGHSAEDLPEAHVAFARSFRSILDAYVAEQTLERLRNFGESIEAVDLRSVRRCLRKARGVLLSFFKLHFYVPKLDRIVAASEPSGVESDIEAGFALLQAELGSNGRFQLRPSFSDSFMVVNSTGSNALAYWCFLTVKRSVGLVTTEVFHPDGWKEASLVLSRMQDMIATVCHRTNQLLLLKSLHKSRVISNLLLREETKSVDAGVEEPAFAQGHFGCPVQFKRTLALDHHSNAKQLVASLEDAVLRSLEISNRRGYFVYKDESGSIFYMTLTAVASTGGSKDEIELVVFGVQQPDPSIKVQLTRLLQKHILTFGVDALSSILQQKPSSSWKPCDIEFVESFEQMWKELENEDAQEKYPQVMEYELPTHAYDPLSLLIFFSQNLCGSTFFHRLNEALPEREATKEPYSDSNQPEQLAPDEVLLDPNEFVFFYNNTPSPLNPKFQALSTLTEKGSAYAREAGIGIAIIKLTLVNVDHEPMSRQRFQVGPRLDSGQCLTLKPTNSEIPVSSLRVKVAGDMKENKNLEDDRKFVESSSSKTKTNIRVQIFDTELKRKILHEWVLLTLNQILVAWTAERYIQKAVTDPPSDAVARESQTTGRIGLGIPGFISILQSSCDLPHPAVKLVEFSGVVRASAVARITLDLLENCLMNAIANGHEVGLQATRVATFGDVLISRSSRKGPEVAVTISREHRPNSETVKIVRLGNINEVVQDLPIDCPEYRCFYCFHQYGATSPSTDIDPPPMLFTEVFVNAGTDEKRISPFVSRMQAIKSALPVAFSRSFAFYLSVKRNRRLLLTYNWDPQLLKTVTSRIWDRESMNLSTVSLDLQSQQRKCLGRLNPSISADRRNVQGKKAPKPETIETKVPLETKDQNNPNKAPSPQGPSRRRIRRPTVIRRPKLIGKSVDGAAAHAMAASRARASSNRFKAPPPTLSKPLAKHSSTKMLRRVSLGSDTAASEERSVEDISSRKGGDEPDELSRMKSEYESVSGSMWAGAFKITRLRLDLVRKHWFATKGIPSTVREILLQESRKLWSHSHQVYPLTWRLTRSDFLVFFSSFLKMQLEGLGPTIVFHDQNQPLQGYTPVYITTKMKRSLTYTTLLLARVMLQRDGTKHTLVIDGWMMQLPLNDAVEARKNRRGIMAIEKRCNAIDTKLGDSHALLNVASQMFDFSAAVVEHAIDNKRENMRRAHLELVEDMISRFPFEAQQEMDGLSYRLFKKRVLLSSYKDALVSSVKSQRLFDYLCSDVESNIIGQCGPDSVYFKQKLHVSETVSCCFVKRGMDSSGETLELIVLCRTEGRNLEHFVFPGESNVATSLLKLVILEGAKVLYNAVRAAAVRIRWKSLWKLFLSPESTPSFADLDELLRYASVKSLLDDTTLQSIVMDEELEIEWEVVFAFMTKETIFRPVWVFSNKPQERRLVHVSSLGCFVLFETELGKLKEIHLVQQERSEDCVMSAQKILVSYLLIFIWQGL